MLLLYSTYHTGNAGNIPRDAAVYSTRTRTRTLGCQTPKQASRACPIHHKLPLHIRTCQALLLLANHLSISNASDLTII